MLSTVDSNYEATLLMPDIFKEYRVLWQNMIIPCMFFCLKQGLLTQNVYGAINAVYSR